MNIKNINNYIYKATFLLVFAIGLLSCQTDLLSPKPKTSFSDLVVFDTPARIELQVNGLYNATKSGNFLGGRYQVYGDIRADDFLNRTNNGVTGYPVWNHTLTETDANAVINCWNAGYAAINQYNVFLQGMDDNASKFVAPTFASNFATTTALNYKGEARLLRALSYYSLLQLYARPYTDGNGSKEGLPLRLKAEKNSLNNDLVRSTVGEIYTQIIADLDFAEANLPLDYTANGVNTQANLRVTRAHRNTAIALKVRAYLSMGQYANVITEANKIVNGSFVATTGVPHALAATIGAVFTAPQLTTESILSFPFTAQNTPGTQNQLAYYFNATDQGGNGEYQLNAAGVLANTTDWRPVDARRAFVVNSVAAGNNPFNKKYPTGTPFTDNAPAIRYSEVLLSLAEARVRSTSTVDAQAIALLNAVRGRSDSGATPFVAGDFATPTALADRIVLERRIEFLGEGIRNQDIMRLMVSIPGKGSVPAIAPTSTLYVFPIPSSELAANNLMTRN